MMFVDIKRNYSLDIIKIFSCVLVVLMHSLRGFDKSVELHPFLYYFTRCSMPLFFMAAGAVQLMKHRIDYKYCFKKIANIIFLMFAYYGCDFLIRIAVSKDFSFSGLLMAAKGAYWDFGVFWFLQTMIIIYLILPFLHKLYKKYPYYLLLLFGGISLLLNIYNIVNVIYFDTNTFVDTLVMQPLRLWIWLFYYILGGIIYAKYNSLKIRGRMLFLIVVITTVMSIAYMYYMFFVTTSIINGEYAYTSLTMMLWASSLMIAILNINFYNLRKVIGSLSDMLIPIYALHYLVIYKVVIPLNVFTGFFEQILGFLLILSITTLASYLIIKVPFMKVFYKI